MASHLKVSILLLFSAFLLCTNCTPTSDYDIEEPEEQVSDKLSKMANIGRHVFEDGSLYEGDLVRGLPDGFGTIKFVSGDFYEGQFLSLIHI